MENSIIILVVDRGGALVNVHPVDTVTEIRFFVKSVFKINA